MTDTELNLLAEKIAEKITEKIMDKQDAITWTLEEASQYSGIGINRLREITRPRGVKWVLWIGESKRLIKVEPFKKWLIQQEHIS